MNNKNLNISLMSKLKCSNCPRSLYPPIIGCTKDHLLCCICLESNAACPDPCNERLLVKQILTQIARCLKYPCNYYSMSRRQSDSFHETSFTFFNKSLNEIVLTQLKCVSCPRAVFPPFSGCSKDHIVCTSCLSSSYRCPSPCFKYLTTKDTLNELASALYYPCFHGCGNSFPSEEIAQHEKQCADVPPKCPVADCEVPISNKHIQDHFKSKHERNIIFRSAKESVHGLPIARVRGRYDFCVTLMIYDKNTMILIYTVYDDNFVSVILKHLTKSNLNSYVILYKNNLIDAKSFGSIFPSDNYWKDYEVERRYCVKIPLEYLYYGEILISFDTDMDSNQLKHIVGVPLPKKAANKLLASIESKFQCPICMQIMRGPIFLCWIGHSICNQCKTKLTNCPICRLSYSARYKISVNPDTDLQRNYFLEEVIENLRKDNLL